MIANNYQIKRLASPKTWHVPVYRRPTWRKFEANENTESPY